MTAPGLGRCCHSGVGSWQYVATGQGAHSQLQPGTFLYCIGVPASRVNTSRCMYMRGLASLFSYTGYMYFDIHVF
jgi:hypothetical protein